MNANTLYGIGVIGCTMACLNVVFWFAAWMSERQWKFTGTGVRRWCAQRVWVNLGVAAVFATAGVAGWWMRA